MDADPFPSSEGGITSGLASMLDSAIPYRDSEDSSDWPSDAISGERWTSAIPALDDLLIANPEDGLSFLPCLGDCQRMVPDDGQEMEEVHCGGETLLQRQDDWQMVADDRLLPAPPAGGDYDGPAGTQLLDESGFQFSDQAYSSGPQRDPSIVLEHISAYAYTDSVTEGEGRLMSCGDQGGVCCAARQPEERTLRTSHSRPACAEEEIVHVTQPPSRYGATSGGISGRAARNQAEATINGNSELLFSGYRTPGNQSQPDAQMGGEEPSSDPNFLPYAGSCTGHAPPMHNAQEHALLGETASGQAPISRDWHDDNGQQSIESDSVMQKSFWDLLQDDNDALMDSTLVSAYELPLAVMDSFPVNEAVSIPQEAVAGLSDAGEGPIFHHPAICPEKNTVVNTSRMHEPPAFSPLLPQDSTNTSLGVWESSLQSRSPTIPINSRFFPSAFPGSCQAQGSGQARQRGLSHIHHVANSAGRESDCAPQCAEVSEGQAGGEAGTSMQNATEQVRRPPNLSARLAQVIDNIGSKRPSPPVAQGAIKRGEQNGVVGRTAVQKFESRHGAVKGERGASATRTCTENNEADRAGKKGRKENMSETEMHALDLAMLSESASGSSSNLFLVRSGSSKSTSDERLGVRRDSLSGQAGANAHDAHSSAQSLKQVHAQVPLLPWLSSGNQNVSMYGMHSNTFMPPRKVPRQVVGMADYLGRAAASRPGTLPVLPKNYGWSFRSRLALDGTFAPARIPRCLAPCVESMSSCHMAEHDLPMGDVREMVMALAEAVATGETVSRQGDGKESERKGRVGGSEFGER